MSTFTNKLSIGVLASGLALACSAYGAESTGQYIDDASITTKVKAALVADSSLSAVGISVTTDHGVVKLTGNVDTPSQYAQAAQDAGGISGVRTVANMLTVRQASAQ